MILRADAIQRLLDLFDSPRYLEIGVDHGQTFKPLVAKRKVAVDPRFNFEFANYSDEINSVEFHEVTSDVYFSAKERKGDMFDVIFLDGLHVAEQTIRDLLNSIMFLQPHGIVIVDDVVPESYHSSLRDTSDVIEVRNYLTKHDSRYQSDHAWMGDVFKVPFFINAFLQQFSYATILENHGQAILWRESRKPKDIKQFSLEGIGRLEFKDFIKLKETLNTTPMDVIIELILSSRAVGSRETE